MATPQYQLTEDMPVPGLPGNGMLLKGSIISMDPSREPGPHMIPLNPEAEECMEAFYSKEFEYKFFDKESGQTVTRKHRPREGLRPNLTPVGASPIGSIELVAPPPEAATKDLSLAELVNTAPKMEGPIPGPAPSQVVREEFRTKASDSPTLEPLVATDPEPVAEGLAVIQAAAPDPKAPKITTK